MKAWYPISYLLILFCSILANRASATDIYVSPAGSDTNPGTVEKPLASLEAARERIRGMRKDAPAESVTVIMRAGAYPIQKTFELGPLDSGSPETPVIFRAYKNEDVTLLGGVQISGEIFRPISDPNIKERIIEAGVRDKVLEADLFTHGIGMSRLARMERFGMNLPSKPAPTELFVDGQPMQIARWPNEGYVEIDEVIRKGSHYRNYMRDVNMNRERYGPAYIPGIFRYKGDRPRMWLHAREVWLHGYWAVDWADDCMPVAFIDPDKREITLSAPHMYGIKSILNQGERYYALNLLEEIDRPGEYYIDPYTCMLYFYPPGPLTGKEISLSLLADPIMTVKDTSHIRFENIRFEACRDTGVEIHGGTRVVMAGCTIRNTGGWAVNIRGGKEHLIQSCDIYNVGKGGVSVIAGDQKTLTSAGHQIVNNHIHHFSRRAKTYQFAVAVNGVGNRVAHNLIHDCPHSAVDYRGNYNIFEFNEIHHVCEESDDAGAVNSDRDYSIRGNVWRHNFFHHIIGVRPDSLWLGAHAIYLDSCTSGDSFIGNVFYKGARVIININGGRDVTVENNIFVDVGHPVGISSIGIGPHRPVVVTAQKVMLDKVDPTSPPWSTAFPKLARYPRDIDELAIPYGNSVSKNLFYNTKEVLIRFAPSVSKDIVTLENNYTAQDDPFVNKADMDFRLKQDARIQEHIPGFVPIPFEQIGLYRDEFRPELPTQISAGK